MTNSIASAKCPSSVLTSGNYGMSQNRYTDDSKEYIFVKLTDSAYRAIEEYQHNANSRRFLHGQCAKIKFVGNSGIIHFPTTTTTTTTTTNDNSIHNNNNKKNNNNGGRQFGFAIDEVEGSLECLQQRQHDLDVLGSLSYRMRIHANEDVYDTTRTKMAIAEETEKSKCIREIKPNQTDIGRKVKKQPLTTSYSSHQQQHHGVNNIALGEGRGGGAGGAGGIGNNNSHNHHSQTTNTSSNFSNSLNRIKGASPNRNSSISSSGGNNHNTKSGNSSNVKMGATASVQQRLSPNPAMIGGSGTIGSTSSINRYGNNSSSSNHQNNSHHSSTTAAAAATATATMASSLSSAFANGIVNGYASATSANAISGTNSKRLKPGVAGINSSSSREGNSTSSIGGDHLKAAPKSLFGSVNNIVSGVKNSNSSNNNKLPDISRRKIRERLIHLLALKPFKKPELYARLQNEGIRERERPLISNILKDISTMSRDNTYNLRRQMWNDVNENWPYYTEQELQLLKRRKPQNLTPPLSSDAGSSTSGQSPTSTHTGSPPPIVSNSLAESGGGGSHGCSSSKSLKRNSLDYDDTLLSSVQVKKQRISHYRKDAMASTIRTAAPIGNAGSGSYGANSRSVLAKNTTSYSPSRQATGIMHGNNDEHFVGVGGETDLSYNVLDNADDFMSHLERDNGSQGSRKAGKKTGNFNSNSTNLKTSSPKYRKAYSKISDNSSATTSTAVSFGGSFVPENKSITNSQNQASANHRNSQHFQQQQRQSPIYAQQPNHNKNTNTSTVGNKSSSSIHSNVRTLSTPSVMLHDDAALTQQSRTGLVSSSSSSSLNCFQHKSSRAPTPPMRGSSNNSGNGDGYNHRQQNVPKNSTKASPETEPQHQHQHQQQHAHHQPVASSSTLQQQTQQQQQQQQHSSPTQQLADAATAYASAYSSTVSPSDKPHYDFSNYTPITTIEQRRKYKTEFESDYDEYLKLLEQIEGVGKRFRGLAARLESARKGCPEFNAIKQQIVSEYERIRNAETLKRDKQRFDYLHEKLAYIKQLVTDYDKTLTSGSGSGSGNGVTPAVISAANSWSSLMPSPKHQQQTEIATTTNLQPTTTAALQNSKQQQLQHYGYQQQIQKQQLQQQHPHHQQQQLQLNQPHSQQRSAMFTTSLTHQIGKETSTDENCGQIKSNKYQQYHQQQTAMQHGQQYQRSHHHRYMNNQNDTNNSDCSSDSNEESEDDDDFNNSQSVNFPNGNANHYHDQLLHEVDDDAHVNNDDSDHDDGDDANVDDSYSNNSNDHDNQNSELF